MAKTDIEWVKRQLENAKVSQAVGTAVMRMMEVWITMNHTDKTRSKTIEVFSELALGHAIVSDDVSVDGQWTPVQPGQIRVSETVRIKPDAYEGDVGMIHNGRIGRVVAVRYGDVIIKSIDDKEPVLDGAHYSPHMLEKFIPA
jgi:hypothetical protein